MVTATFTCKMFETIDLYCERPGPGLWSEPVNAITNLSFFVAAIAIWRHASRHNSHSFDAWLLIGLALSIGVGSMLFHTYATTWARILDIVPILMFQVAYLWIYGRKIIKFKPGNLSGIVALFIFTAYIGRQFSDVLNGSLIYAPAFALLLGLGLYHFYNARIERTLLLWAAGVFSLSLFFRSIDMTICANLSLGTHFLWHLLNGLVVYIAVRVLLVSLPVRVRNGG